MTVAIVVYKGLIPVVGRILTEKLIENKEHISVIQDDYGCMRGIVTMEDVIETMLGVEIVDENDKAIDMQEFAKKTSENYRKTARIIKGEK